MNVVMICGDELKANARIRFLREDVSATMISSTYEKPLIPTWYITFF